MAEVVTLVFELDVLDAVNVVDNSLFEFDGNTSIIIPASTVKDITRTKITILILTYIVHNLGRSQRQP